MISQLAHVTSLIGIEWLSHHNMDERAFQNTIFFFLIIFPKHYITLGIQIQIIKRYGTKLK